MSQVFTNLAPQQGDGIRILEAKILTVLRNGGGGGGGGGTNQVVSYTVDPPSAPPNASQPAIAYDPTGNLPTKGWNVGSQSWT